MEMHSMIHPSANTPEFDHNQLSYATLTKNIQINKYVCFTAAESSEATLYS
jgi:hypothetical protein